MFCIFKYGSLTHFTQIESDRNKTDHCVNTHGHLLVSISLNACVCVCEHLLAVAEQAVSVSRNTHHNGPLCSRRWWLRRTQSNASWFWTWPSCRLPRDRPRPSSAPRPSNCWQDYMRYTGGELTSAVRATDQEEEDGDATHNHGARRIGSNMILKLKKS